ncbi:helix-turn-helix domain-containing protein [Yokenella regensburgei]|uniref:helix-turn-helix domain-containing protein n=1 Tax=Yokenella regensburgei TaxID=158877 RepID=UPI001432B35F|nr:LysR family transcriptional regulator [Yokenella regensburgei]QIU92591.1 LysR family transcriptional regulator [Yokenella regensburgei]
MPCNEDNAINVLMNIDFKSILAFVVVVETGNLYCASVLLGCSQPAVSIYLKRVRKAFINPLFMKEGRHLVPTDYAIALSRDLRKSLGPFCDIISKNTSNLKKESKQFKLVQNHQKPDFFLDAVI